MLLWVWIIGLLVVIIAVGVFLYRVDVRVDDNDAADGSHTPARTQREDDGTSL